MLLKEIAVPYLTTYQWPLWDYVVRRLGATPSEAHAMLTALPRVGSQGLVGSSYGFTTGDWRNPSPGEPIRLTVAAALHVEELRPILAEPFLEALRYMVDLAESAVPSPFEVTQPRMLSVKLSRAVPTLKPGFIKALPGILDGEPVTWRGGISGPNPPDDPHWNKEVTQEVLPYRGVDTLEKYVATTCGNVERQAAEHRGAIIGQPSTLQYRLPGFRAAPVEVPAAEEPDETFTQATPGPYIQPGIISDLEKLDETVDWSLDKLIALLSELNHNHAAGNVYSCLAMVRAVFDHIPPAFGAKGFAEVLSSRAWGKTDAAYVKRLAESRQTSDDVLHRPLRKSPSRIDLHDLPNRSAVNALLQGLIEELRKGAGTV